jgi:hypothetical protein
MHAQDRIENGKLKPASEKFAILRIVRIPGTNPPLSVVPWTCLDEFPASVVPRHRSLTSA